MPRRGGLDLDPHGELPALDDRLAPPETRLEYLEGGELYAMPADEPHATAQCDLGGLLLAHAKEGYRAAVDMLMRADESSDFAPDASIFPAEKDPETGRRQLEELAFEVTSKQRLRVPTAKARKLIARGVRRVFCVLVEQRRVLEWSRKTDGWKPLRLTSQIRDRTLIRPLPVRSLLEATARDDAIAEALLSRRVPAIERALAASKTAGREEGREEGVLIGKRDTLLALLRSRGIRISDGARRCVEACEDPATLDGWIARVFDETSDAYLKSAPRRRASRRTAAGSKRRTR